MNDYILATEKALIGSIIRDNRHFDEATEKLGSEDFSIDSHCRLWRRICEMLQSGRAVDFYTLQVELAAHIEVEAIGGRAYLAALTELLPLRSNVADYVRIVAAAAKRRRSHGLISGMLAQTEDPGEDVDEVLDRGIARMLELQTREREPAISQAIVPLLDRLKRERARKGELLGLPTGLPSLDQMTRGMQPSELVVVGACTGVGKSAHMVQSAIANCKAGNRVLIFSLEMTQEQILRRIFAMVSGVPFCSVRDPKWASDQDMAKIEYAAAAVADWPLEIDPNGAIHIDKLVAKARHAIRRHGVKLVCIDYCQIVAADGRDERLRIAAVSRGAARLAKDENVSVMLLSQLSRDKTNPNRRPRLSDLRETSQLEADAHVVVLLHRPADEEERAGSEAEVIIAKQRSGATAILPFSFDQKSLQFEERNRSVVCQAAAS